MANEKVLSQSFGGIGRLVFNNPDKHNALSLEMWRRAGEILDEFRADDDIRVVVLSGAGGKAFVSGADISKFEEERASGAAIREYNEVVGRVSRELHGLPKPTIAMIQGYCIGGGLALAACCDLRICAEGSRFGLPAAKLGLGYPFDGLKRLADTIGLAHTRDICFTARQFDASEAAAMGLVNRVVPAAELEAVVQDCAETIAGNAPLTIRAMKCVFGEIAKDPTERDLAACQSLVDACFSSADYAEGRRAFVEKRKPVFTGR